MRHSERHPTPTIATLRLPRVHRRLTLEEISPRIAGLPEDSVWVVFLKHKKPLGLGEIRHCYGSALPQQLDFSGMAHPVWRNLAARAWNLEATWLAFGRTTSMTATAFSLTEADTALEQAFGKVTQMLGLAFESYYVAAPRAPDDPSLRLVYASRLPHAI